MTASHGLNHWARERERGSSFLLRSMVWISFRLGQMLGESLLLPIVAWFLATSPASRAASRDFLRRALGRPVGIADVARHFFEFAKVILDRAFFLSDRAGHYVTDVEGLEYLETHIQAGRGCILVGAHLGSFEAMRALARRSPVTVRPAMYRVNAGALTAVLEQLDPQLAARVIDIGQPGAMLQVRESLGRGDLVAFLADRATDPRRSVALPFFGEPALFPTGPFKVATMLGTPVAMFLAIRVGRRRYLLRFEPLPPIDPETVPSAGASNPEEIGPDSPPSQNKEFLYIMRLYVARLEAACRIYPFQWFNFYPFWRHATPPDGEAVRRAPSSAARIAVLIAALVAPWPVQAADDPLQLLTTVIRMLGEKTQRQSTFREKKTVPHLTKPLACSGILIYRPPDRLEKRTLSPIREDLVVEGRRASLTGGDGIARVVDIDSHAELRVVIDTLLGVLSGNLTALQTDFDVTAEGDAANWRLVLRPRGKDAPRFLRDASVSGQMAAIREIRLLLPQGHWDVIAVDGG